MLQKLTVLDINYNFFKLIGKVENWQIKSQLFYFTAKTWREHDMQNHV